MTEGSYARGSFPETGGCQYQRGTMQVNNAQPKGAFVSNSVDR